MENLTDGLKMSISERQKQVSKHGFTGEHHADHPEWYSEDQLVYAANALSQRVNENAYPETPKNWDEKWFRDLCDRPREERLIIASALLVSEVDRGIAIKKRNND